VSRLLRRALQAVQGPPAFQTFSKDIP
jgi:hypothetical protein